MRLTPAMCTPDRGELARHAPVIGRFDADAVVSAEYQGNIVIFRIGSIGDTVVALPCFHAIEREFPEHRRILLTNALASVRASSVESVLQSTGLIHDAIYFPLGQEGLRRSLALAGQLRRLRPETLVYLTPRPDRWSVLRDLAFFRAGGVRRVIGAPLAHDLRNCRVDSATGELEHEADRLARILRNHLPVDMSAASWNLRLTAAERATAESHLKDLPVSRAIVAMSPGAKVAAKDWGENNWAQLIDHLDKRFPPVSLVLLGAPDEGELVARLARHWSGPVLDLAGRLTPRESAAVLARCGLLVCHDSGPMHLAANQGTPCVALFGNYNRPRRWFPYGKGHRVIYEPAGVRAISVARAALEIDAILKPMQSSQRAVRARRIRSTSADVDFSGNNGTSATRPPDDSTSSRPTTSSTL